MLFGIILGVTVFATFAMMVRDGIWSNSILLVLILLSGLTAFGVYQPLTALLDERTGGEYTYALDLVVIWFTYVFVFSVLKAICDALSKTKMKFPGPIDDAVGPVVGLLAGVVLAGFVGATLHVAPLPRDGLGGGMDYKGTSVAAAPLYALDAQWLRMVEAASNSGLGGRAGFDAQEFVDLYAKRREILAEEERLLVRRK